MPIEEERAALYREQAQARENFKLELENMLAPPTEPREAELVGWGPIFNRPWGWEPVQYVSEEEVS